MKVDDSTGIADEEGAGASYVEVGTGASTEDELATCSLEELGTGAGTGAGLELAISEEEALNWTIDQQNLPLKSWASLTGQTPPKMRWEPARPRSTNSGQARGPHSRKRPRRRH